ncbi:hypothetical protein PQJ75_08650 [Rhodoplanes sp. TEM]|uniref:Uncharacterized protein n=1 Tax=Rhodoplanes tepidamans TaxID=200616 RepID=A0ABT5J9T5_RHOTP|nr:MULTISPECIES: hypothetical protein [Rhodoplanes]MDC7786064.1 hypothetical protein [Rhodoplanes tepidamans]MDC7983795.1 hypothetical protein [Rhodoplanes sp. TEM]MDQ0354907.1 hypothetical protein [Rhodoplanes tepidamans]
MSLLHPSLDHAPFRRERTGPRMFGVYALAGVLLIVLAARLVPSAMALPALSLAALAGAALFALVATLRNEARGGDVSSWDVAGVLALLGFSAAMLSEAEHVATAFGHTLVAMAP